MYMYNRNYQECIAANLDIACSREDSNRVGSEHKCSAPVGEIVTRFEVDCLVLVQIHTQVGILIIGFSIENYTDLSTNRELHIHLLIIACDSQ